MFQISQIINYRHLNCLSDHLMMLWHCHTLITKISVLYARMTTSLCSPILSIASVWKQILHGVDLLVIVYEIRNDTIFNHSSIISSYMALECPDIVFYISNVSCIYICTILPCHISKPGSRFIRFVSRISNISATATHAQLIFCSH